MREDDIGVDDMRINTAWPDYKAGIITAKEYSRIVDRMIEKHNQQRMDDV